MRTFSILFIFFVFSSCEKNTDYLITIKTEYGEMKAVLFDDTPLHKENFLKLSKEGLYDSTVWHRVIDEFMIQGGDVNQKTGFFDSIKYTIPAEFNRKYFHRRGAIAAARRADNINPEKESSGCHFYIVNGKVWNEKELTTDMNKLSHEVARLIQIPKYDSIGQVLRQVYQEGRFDEYNKMLMDLIPDVEKRLGADVTRPIPPSRVKVYTTIGGSPWLDDTYTVFGQVVEGLDVIDKIAQLPKDHNDRPFKNTYLTIEVEELPKAKITELYGIEYPEN